MNPLIQTKTLLSPSFILAVGLCLISSRTFGSPPALTTQSLAASETHAMALRSEGTVWSWGTNRIGETGLGANLLTLSPRRISSLSNIVSIAAGPLHGLAVQSNGSMWAWGTNGDGRIGNGTLINSSVPVAVSRITNAIATAAGNSHSLALLKDGHVMAWGLNSSGQLGNGGSPAATNQPVYVSALTNVIAVAAGNAHSLALTVDGEVWSWGYNGYGQLGLGNTSTKTTPNKITVLSNIVQIAIGDHHSLALDSSGRVFAWGLNNYGEIGIGTTANVTTPTLVTNAGSCSWIAGGLFHSAAIGTNGTLYYWGFNTFSGAVKYPTALGGGQTFKTVQLGDYFLLATKEDGSVWAWGKNSAGEWGNEYTYTGYYQHEVQSPVFSFAPHPYAQATRFNRGDRENPNYNSFMLPLDLEKGVKLDATGQELYEFGQGTPWFLRLTNSTVYQAFKLTTGTNLSRIAVQNPVAAYGSLGGGSPLYTGQGYTFGLYAGAFDENSGQTNILRVSVYNKATCLSGASNIAPVNVFNIALPRRSVAAESNVWMNFVTNEFVVVSQTNDLRTTVEFVDGAPDSKPWGLSWLKSGGQPLVATNVVLAGYRVTHTATSTNYCYKVEVLGSAQVAANTMAPMATNSSGAWVPLPLYTLDFEAQPLLRSRFIDQPHFEGIPVPPEYAGRDPKELNGMVASITNSIWVTNNAAYTNLDTSPELLRSPILDQFVKDLGRDPLALATYVINQIELTDPFAMVDSSKVVADSIQPGGINRSALGVFLEKQGSPVEQCSLLVYLLRQAGYSAGYVWPTNSNLRLLDTTVSKLWEIQVKGVVTANGIPYITNSLIVANYPWVVVNIGTNSVQIFPWLKDHEIVEGPNVYDYLPTRYSTAFAWVKDYVLGNPNILNFAPESNLPMTLWPLHLSSLLQTNSLNQKLSWDDFGVRTFNRQNQFPTWQDLPKPNFLTNQNQVAVVPTLSENTTTYPFLLNIFDKVHVEVYKNSISSANLLFNTGDWYACNLHNRKLLLYTNAPNSLTLWLAPFISGVTNSPGNFTGPWSTNLQTATHSLVANDKQISVRVIHKRRRATLSNPKSFFQFNEVNSATNDANCMKGDVAAICMSFGKVTPEMLRVHAEEYWGLERQRATHTTFVPAVADNQGSAAMLLGMGYFQKLSRFDEMNQRIHKVHGLSAFMSGLGVIGAVPTKTKMQPKVDMKIQTEAILGNGSLHPDSGDAYYNVAENYDEMLIVNGSAQEHDIINSTFNDDDAISTVRLLQLAVERADSHGWAKPLELNRRNYETLGNATYTGYGSTKLKNQDASMWGSVSNAFTLWDADYVRVLITPGPVANDSATYKGMGALILTKGSKGALISANKANLNGGWGSVVAGLNPSGSTFQMPWNLNVHADGSVSFEPNNFSQATPQSVFSPLDSVFLGTGAGSSRILVTPFQGELSAFNLSQFGLSGTAAFGLQLSENLGRLDGNGSYAGNQQPYGLIGEPVDSVSGTFYLDTVDLNLPGPLPLQLRRNYLSRNLADNELGYGWKINFMPFLVVATNATTNVLIQAANPDGSVITYRGTTSGNLFVVTPQDNPTLGNNTTAGIGATANSFNAKLQRYTTNGVTYVLSMPDGNKRTYQQMDSFGLSSGTNHLNRVRPYLTRWEDHAGNYHSFYYGTNSAANDYGELNRIESANGNFLQFDYDFYGRITEAFTGDGRRVKYEYDSYGDLVRVVLPDASECVYNYAHYSFTTNSHTYWDSNHLLTKETKPDGRILLNAYDNLRRVVTQAATVSTNQALTTNAYFFYTNNFTSLTNTFITGVTRVEDVFHHPTLYYYTNNLIMRIVDPLGRTTVQNWYETSETNKTGYYPRSLEYTVDARGLTNEFRYDTSGNVTNLVVRGDLSGDGITSQSATNVYTYTNNLPDTMIDPSGIKTASFYDGADPFRVVRVERSVGGVGIATNCFSYTNATSTVDLGYWTKTNKAFGLRFREIKADSATNDFKYDGRGFMVQSVQYSGTADPNVTNFFAYNARGQLYQKSDSLGRTTRADFDAMGRPKWRDVIDENGAALSRETFYYNRNGELEWYDGPGSNPEDYVFYDYDGAGRKIQELHWQARAKADGTGVEAETGDDLYATTFFTYDGFGNLVKTINPRGVTTTNGFDAMGQLIVKKVFETNGTLLTSENFRYEPGGKVGFQTNALGGVTEMQYTFTGQPKYQKNPDGSTNAWRYYLDGRIYREIQENGAYWQTTYDDANRKVTRVFYSAVGSALATNVSELDRRGNLVRKTDAGGNLFTTVYDGLNRVKAASGPRIESLYLTGINPASTNYLTNVVQQITGYTYDDSGKVLITTNVFGEKTVTTGDALGRPISVEIYASNSVTPLRVTSTSYSADHHSVTTVSGTGAGAITSTSFTDNAGHTVLSVTYPQNGLQEFTRRTFDSVGNLLAEARQSANRGMVTTWQTSSFSYDGLNRVHTKTELDNAVTTFGYDASGNLTSRLMPGGSLTWSATYNNASQILTEKDSNGASTTRNISYAYYPTGNQWAGLLKTVTDGNGVIRTNAYDHWLHVASVSTTGPLDEQKMECSWNYDPRGLITNITQSYANLATGPDTSIERQYNQYRQMISEQVSLDGGALIPVWVGWDSAGRRIQADGMNFQYRADGLMSAVNNSTFGYGDNGLMTGRTNGSRAVSIDQRDGTGRPLQRTTRVNTLPVLTESWNWTEDGMPSQYVAGRSDFTDSRNFTYAALTRRLAQETLNLANNVSVTNAYTFDNGAAGGMGVLTAAGQAGTLANSWTGGLDTFSRVSNGTNSLIHRIADGTVNGAARLRGYVNGQPVDVRYDPHSNSRWTTDMALRPGTTNTLVVYADHPSGQFTTNKQATFTIAGNAYDKENSLYDGSGNVTNRVWKRADGAVVRTQTLTWDAFGRLAKITERDASGNGLNFVSVFDGLGRQIQTTETTVTNSVALTVYPAPITTTYHYDPQFEFLMIGVAVSQGSLSHQDWLAYGPDISGTYGGMQGIGGLETIVAPPFSVVIPVINDAFGNVLGAVTNGVVTWNSARVNLYAPVEGYAPPRPSVNVPLYASLAWRTRPINAAGLVQMGARPYDPIRRAFLAADPLGHESDPALNTAFNGNPAVYFDANGMLASQAMDFTGGAIKGFAEGYLGINVSGPANTDEYHGQQFGRNTAFALAAWLTAKGGIDTIAGSGTMGTSLAVEATTVGLATPVAGPTFLEGAALTLKGVIETGIGSIGLVNHSKLDPLEQPSDNSGSSRTADKARSNH